MARVAGKRGKLPYNPDKPNIKLRRQHFSALAPWRTTLPPTPSSLDRLTAVLRALDGLPMYGNADYGDCVWAMIGHAIQVMTYANWGAAEEQTVTVDALLKGYHDVTGFDPSDPNTDQGTNIQDALDYWRKTGIRRVDGSMDQILAFAEIDHTDLEMMKHAISIFDVVLVGVNLPQSAEEQFAQKKPWTLVKGSPVLGGHAILDGGYNTVNSVGDLEHLDATWGNDTRIEQDFWNECVEETWIVITKNLMAKNGGAGPSGFNMNIFAEDFQEMTGQPFQPGPDPINPPTPTPSPAPIGYDAFKTNAETWLNHRHTGINATFARAVEKFLVANS